MNNIFQFPKKYINPNECLLSNATFTEIIKRKSGISTKNNTEFRLRIYIILFRLFFHQKAKTKSIRNKGLFL